VHALAAFGQSEPARVNTAPEAVLGAVAAIPLPFRKKLRSSQSMAQTVVMVTRDLLSDLAALIHPMPRREQVDPPEYYDDACQTVHDERERWIADKRAALDAADAEGVDYDPLLSELADAREAMRRYETVIRRLIAYGREFVGPRPYRLDDLARAAGLSISGTRTAYGPDEIADVRHHTGARPRRHQRREGHP
jgi:hypothetical protein